MNATKSRWLWPVLELTGIAAIFLPFTWTDSPWGVVIAALSHDRSGGGDFFWLGFPFGLAVIISALGFLDLAGKKLSAKLAWGVTVLGIAAGPGLTVSFMVMAIASSDQSDYRLLYILVFLLCVIPLGLALLGKRKDCPAATVTNAIVRAAYLPNLVLCFVGFFRDGLKVGAGFAAVTGILYAIHGGVIVARARRN